MEHPVNPEEGAAELARRAAKLKGLDAELPLAAEQAARDVAAGVKGMAQRNGHKVAIRVIAQGSVVRLTVVGPQAVRYRRLVEVEMKRRVPDIQAEIRTQITRRAR